MRLLKKQREKTKSKVLRACSLGLTTAALFCGCMPEEQAMKDCNSDTVEQVKLAML